MPQPLSLPNSTSAGNIQTWCVLHASFSADMEQACVPSWKPTMSLPPCPTHIPTSAPLTQPHSSIPGTQTIPTPSCWGTAHSDFSSLILPTARGNDSSSGNLAACTLGWDRQCRNNCLFEYFIGRYTCFLLLWGPFPLRAAA